MEFKILIISILLSTLVAPLIQLIFLKYKIFDPINQRSSHSVLATRTGGLACFSVFFLISIYFYLFEYEVYDFSLLIPLSIMFIIGVYDDFYDANFKLKFLIQIIVCKILIDQGLVIDNFYGIFNLYEIPRISSQLFTVFVFLVIVNSINFIDGIDGLGLTEIIKILTIFLVINYQNNSKLYLGLVIISSLIPLYFYNFRKQNKIFLGDGGSLFLGTLISVYTFGLLNSDFQLPFSFNKPLLSILILLYPLIDLLRVFIIRVSNRKSPFYPDNNHLHHFLLRKKINHWKISIILPFGFLLLSFFIGFLIKTISE